jgi:uncharacterized protein YjdB
MMKANRGMQIRFGVIAALVGAFLLVVPLVAQAKTASELAADIQTYGLNAAVSGNTVTVTGAKTVSSSLFLDLNPGVTVLWNAQVTGKGNDNDYALIELRGSGTLIVGANALIKNTEYHEGYGIYQNDLSKIIVNGGTIEACGWEGAAIYSQTGQVTVNAGLILASAEAGMGIWIDYVDLVVTGGVIRATGEEGKAVFLEVGEDAKFTMSGGTIEATGLNAYAVHLDDYHQIVQISGGTIRATGDYSYGLRIRGGQIDMVGGLVEVTGPQSAALINNNGNINVHAGIVRANGAYGTAVSADGNVTIKAQALVTATGEGGVPFTGSGSTNVTIGVFSIALTKPASASITPGASLQLGATIVPANAANRLLNWTSSNPAVARVAAGKVTAVSEGFVTITATSTDGTNRTASTTVLVAKPVTKVRVPVSKVTVKVKGSLTVPVAADNGTSISAKLTYTSSNPAVATVSAAGMITGKKAGSAVITIKALNGTSTKITVTVVKKSAKISKIKIKAAPKLKKGKTAFLTFTVSPAKAPHGKISIKSSKPNVLTVDKAGKLTTKKKGKATITVKVGAKKATKTITVK